MAIKSKFLVPSALKPSIINKGGPKSFFFHFIFQHSTLISSTSTAFLYSRAFLAKVGRMMAWRLPVKEPVY